MKNETETENSNSPDTPTPSSTRKLEPLNPEQQNAEISQREKELKELASKQIASSIITKINNENDKTNANPDLNALVSKYDAANLINDVVKNVNIRPAPTLEALSNSFKDANPEVQQPNQNITIKEDEKNKQIAAKSKEFVADVMASASPSLELDGIDLNIIDPQENGFASLFSEIGNKFNEMVKDSGNAWNLLSNTIARKEKFNFTDITDGVSDAAQQTSEKVNEKDSKLTSDQKNQVSKINDYISKEALIAVLKQVAQTLGMQKEDGQEQSKGEQRQNKSQTFRDKIFSNMVTNITGYFNAIMTPNEETKPEGLETEQKDRMAEDIKVVGDQLDVAGTKLQGGTEVLKGYFNDAFTSVNNSSTISATQAKDLIAKPFKQIQSLAANAPDLQTIIASIENNIKYFTGGYEKERDETHKKKTKEESRVTEDTEKNVQQEQDSNTPKEAEIPLNTIDAVKKTQNSDLDKKDLPEDNITSALLSNNEEEVKNQRTNHDTLPNSMPNLSNIKPELISKLNNQEGLNQIPQNNQGPDGFNLGYRLGKLEQKVDEMRPPEASEKPGMSNGMKAALAIGFFILLLINPAFAFIAATVVGAGVVASSSGFGQLTNGNKEQSRQSGKENEKSGILQRFFKSREREKEGTNDIESSTSPKPENTKIAHSTAPKAPYTMKADSNPQGQWRG